MRGPSLQTWIALGVGLLGVAAATPASSAASSPAPTSSTPSQSNCPYPIGLKNSGFESGKIAPWAPLSNTSPDVKQKIHAKGYNNSKYALEIDFPSSAETTECSLAQSTTGKECFGYYYVISFSYNWLKYSGPEGDGSDNDSYCSLNVITGYTQAQGNGSTVYGSRTPGWHHQSYVARDVYSHGMDLSSDYVVNVVCFSKGEKLPGFTLLIDDLRIRSADLPPGPAPTNSF